jgi:hypothetical protein
MKRIAFWTVLAMTASSVAMAAPARVADRDVYQRDREVAFSHDHYGRYAQSHWAQDFHGRWTPIVARASARPDRTLIPVNGRFRKLRVEGVRGEPTIARVTIEFGNGGSQSVELNASLPRGTGEVIDLNGDQRQIRRIIVEAAPGTRGQFAIWGA